VSAPRCEYRKALRLTTAKQTNTVGASSFRAHSPQVIGTTNCGRSTESPSSSAVQDGIFHSDRAPLFSTAGIISASGDSCGSIGSGFHPPWSGVKSKIYNTAPHRQNYTIILEALPNTYLAPFVVPGRKLGVVELLLQREVGQWEASEAETRGSLNNGLYTENQQLEGGGTFRRSLETHPWHCRDRRPRLRSRACGTAARRR
jgi:hypothetical protein